MRRKIFFALLLLAAVLAPIATHAQTITTASAKVLDPAGLEYANGQLTISLVPPSGGVSPYVTATGSPIILSQTVNLDNNASFSVGLVANGSITPASTTYTFRVCGIAIPFPIGANTQSCFTVTGITISGSTQSISANLNSASVRLARTWAPERVFFTLPAAGTSSISATTMDAAVPSTPATGIPYTFEAYISQTVLGASCAGNSTITVNLIYQDVNAAAPQTQAIGTYTVTTNGTLGIVPLTSNAYAGRITITSAPASVVQYSTTYSAGGSCSPAPAVQVFPVLLRN
jgi:hypothetical protein